MDVPDPITRLNAALEGRYSIGDEEVTTLYASSSGMHTSV